MKEKEYIFQTQDEVITSKITGELRALIIKSDVKIHIKIISELGYIVFEDLGFIGIKYINPKSKLIDDIIIPNEYIYSNFYLNEKLIIKSDGTKSVISIIVRYHDDSNGDTING